MNDAELLDLKQAKEFVSASNTINFQLVNQIESYKWIARTLKRFDCFSLSKTEKDIVRTCISKTTKYSRAQLNLLFRRYKRNRCSLK